MPFQVNVSQMREALATIVAGAEEFQLDRDQYEELTTIGETLRRWRLPSQRDRFDAFYSTNNFKIILALFNKAFQSQDFKRADELREVGNIIGQYMHERYRSLVASERRLARLPAAVRFARSSPLTTVKGTDNQAFVTALRAYFNEHQIAIASGSPREVGKSRVVMIYLNSLRHFDPLDLNIWFTNFMLAPDRDVSWKALQIHYGAYMLASYGYLGDDFTYMGPEFYGAMERFPAFLLGELGFTSDSNPPFHYIQTEKREDPLLLFIPSSPPLGAPDTSAERVLDFLAHSPLARHITDTVIVTNSLEEESSAVVLSRDDTGWHRASGEQAKQAFQEGAILLAKNSWEMMHESPEQWSTVKKMAERGVAFAVQGEDFAQASNLHAGLALQALQRGERDSALDYRRHSFQWGPYARAIEGLIEALTLIRTGRIPPDERNQLMDLLANQPYFWIDNKHYLMTIGMMNMGLVPEGLPAFFGAIEQGTPFGIDLNYEPGQLIVLGQAGISELIKYAQTIPLSDRTTNMVATASALQEPLLHLQLAMEGRVIHSHERDGLTQAVIRDRIVNAHIGEHLTMGGLPLSRAVRGILNYPDHVTPFLVNHSSDQETPPRIPHLLPATIDAMVTHLERLESGSHGGPGGGGAGGGGAIHRGTRRGLHRLSGSDEIAEARGHHRHREGQENSPLLALQTGAKMMTGLEAAFFESLTI